MITLFDILKSAQGGNAFANLGAQYGLSPDAVQSAASALMPALSSGFQNALQNPMAFAGLAGQMLDPAHLASFNNPQALAGEAVKGGQALLTNMFGNNEVITQIIDHASQICGLQQQALAQLFPAFASLIGGGLLQNLNANGLTSGLSQLVSQAQSGNLANDAMVGVTTAMQSGWQAGLGAMMGVLTGAQAGAVAGAQSGAQAGANQGAASSLASMAQSFLGNFLGGGAAAPAPQAAPAPEAPAANPMASALSSLAGMLQPGVDVSAAHQDMLNSCMSMATNARKR